MEMGILSLFLPPYGLCSGGSERAVNLSLKSWLTRAFLCLSDDNAIVLMARLSLGFEWTIIPTLRGLGVLYDPMVPRYP